jgi:hypothetical protein
MWYSFGAINPLRNDGDFCHQGQDTKIGQKIKRLSKHTDMTIHWEALSDGTISLSIYPFPGKI